MDTTNQRMELMAVAQALLALGKTPYYHSLERLVVMSDSRYVVDCFLKKWHVGWERRGWKTAGGDPVKHEKLWRSTIKLVRAWEAKGVAVEFKWVKGHVGDPLNERADELAVQGRTYAKSFKS